MRTTPIASSPDAPTTRLATLRLGISCPRPNTTESLTRSLPADNQSRLSRGQRILHAIGFRRILSTRNLPPRATEAVYYPAREAFLQHAVDSFLVDPRLTSQFVCLYARRATPAEVAGRLARRPHTPASKTLARNSRRRIYESYSGC